MSLESYLTVMMRVREEELTSSILAAERLPLFPFNSEIPQAKEKAFDCHPLPFSGRRSFGFQSLLLQGLFLSFNVVFYAFFDM